MAKIHSTAQVADSAKIGENSQVWLHCQIRERVIIGDECILGKNVYVDADVTIGNRVKIQNNVSVFHGVTIEDGVFVGPHVCFTNDKMPRAINVDGTLKAATDWEVAPTRIGYGAALGAHSVIVCGTTIGKWAMIGSGAVVTKDVPDFALVLGNPGRVVGYVTPDGRRAEFKDGICVLPTGGRLVLRDGCVSLES